MSTKSTSVENTQLIDILQKGTVDSVIQFFHNKTDDERHAFLSLVQKVTKEYYINLDFGQMKERLPIFSAAYYSICTLTEFRKDFSKILPMWRDFEPELLATVLADRRPDWIDQLIIDLMNYKHAGDNSDNGHLYLACRKLNVCSHLSDEAVIFRLIKLFDGGYWETCTELFDYEFWLIFEMEFKSPYWFTTDDSLGYSEMKFLLSTDLSVM